MSEHNGLTAMLAASIVGVRRVIVSGRGQPPSARGIYDCLLRPVYKKAVMAQKITLVTNSASTVREYAAWLDVPPNRVGVVYNGVDVDEILRERDREATASHRRSLGITDSTIIVGSVFNARREKRPQLWVEAAAAIARRVPDVAFVLVGGGRWMEEVASQLPALGLEGRLHRPGIRKDVATWLELMDVVLLTSELEGTPNVLLEAQALGRPVVATDVGGCAETFLPEQTGILLPTHPSAEEVAEAVTRILNDRGFMERANDEGSVFIRERYCAKRMAAELTTLCFARSDRRPL